MVLFYILASFVKDESTIGVLVCFWVLCSVPLICLFNCQITIYLYTLFISLKEVLKLVSASLPALDIYRQLNPRKVEYTFFSSSSGKNTKIDHILGHKTDFKKFKRRTSLVTQWLRLHTLHAGGPGLIPGRGTRSHMPKLKILYVARVWVPQLRLGSCKSLF